MTCESSNSRKPVLTLPSRVSGVGPVRRSVGGDCTTSSQKTRKPKDATPTATDIGDWDGICELNLAAALTATAPTTSQTWTPGTGTGSLDAARGYQRVIFNSLALKGENDLFGPFGTAAWATASAARTAWSGGKWMGHQMAGKDWSGTSWAARTWAPAAWPLGFWGAVWTDDDWSGHYWTGQDWSGHYWTGHYWSSSTW